MSAGSAGRRSGERKGKRTAPVALGDALGQFTAELGIAPRLREYEAVIRWPSIVGERIARVSKPLRVEKGVLVVNVESAPWRSELTLRRREILEKVNSTLGGPVIREIRFR